MLDLKHIILEDLNTTNGQYARFVRLKNLMDTKANTYLQWTATKNQVNRASDYHYLMLAVAESTAPVNGIDYIHPNVKPVVDYATAVITKGLIPNGEINFEFQSDHEGDAAAARQATEMVSKIVNQQNDPHFVLTHWVMDAVMHKNGMMMVLPEREQIVRYVTTQGTADQLTAFEQQARDSGLEVLRQSRRKTRVDMEAAMAEISQFTAALPQNVRAAQAEEQRERLMAAADQDLDGAFGESQVAMATADTTADFIADALNRNTIYTARYKLTGYNLTIRFRSIAQHYWICDPTVMQVKDQPFCGYYEDMTIAEATEMYPDIKLDLFMEHAEYNNNGAYQSGSVLNNMAIHARDSVPIQGIPVGSGQAADEYSRRITVLTVWNRYDIDGDGELELVEMIYSGSYIISAREVEFIPVANMCPKPLPGNFYGMSVAESVVPQQEYATAAARAEIQLGLLTATPRLGVKPDKVDFQMLQDGESAIFILDTKFDPATDVYPLPPPSGDLRFLEAGLTRIQQDTMAMVGMTTPQDVFNPEIMAPGNSGIKLQMALTPNQIIQDNTVRCAADGLKEAIWLVWRTLIQYGDDYGVKKLAADFHPDGQPVFLDYQSWDDMNFCDRKQLSLELALGMASEENQLARIQLIQQAQEKLYASVSGMASQGSLTPEIFKKIKKPYEDMLYVLGVKDVDTYLPSDQEVLAMIQQAQAAAQNKTPTPAEQKDTTAAMLNEARTQEILSGIEGTNADSQLEYMAVAMGQPKVYNN
jgi:hypothetical protein